jgi:phage gp36-like protein
MTTAALPITLHALGAETAAGTGTSVDLQADGVGLRSVLDLSALVTSGVAVLTIQTSADGEVWGNVGVLSAPPGTTRARFSPSERYARAKWTTSGAIFRLAGTALQLFASVDDLHAFGLPSAALPGVTADTKLRHLLAATERVRSYLEPRSGPITQASADIQQVTCQIAAAALLAACVGVNPESMAHKAVVDAAKQAQAWLAEVRDGKVGAGVKDSTPTVAEGCGAVTSEALRGWGSEWGTDLS